MRLSKCAIETCEQQADDHAMIEDLNDLVDYCQVAKLSHMDLNGPILIGPYARTTTVSRFRE